MEGKGTKGDSKEVRGPEFFPGTNAAAVPVKVADAPVTREEIVKQLRNLSVSKENLEREIGVAEKAALEARVARTFALCSTSFSLREQTLKKVDETCNVLSKLRLQLGHVQRQIQRRESKLQRMNPTTVHDFPIFETPLETSEPNIDIQYSPLSRP